MKDMYFNLGTFEMKKTQFTRTVGGLKSETPYEIDVIFIIFIFFFDFYTEHNTSVY